MHVFLSTGSRRQVFRTSHACEPLLSVAAESAQLQCAGCILVHTGECTFAHPASPRGQTLKWLRISHCYSQCTQRHLCMCNGWWWCSFKFFLWDKFPGVKLLGQRTKTFDVIMLYKKVMPTYRPPQPPPGPRCHAFPNSLRCYFIFFTLNFLNYT